MRCRVVDSLAPAILGEYLYPFTRGRQATPHVPGRAYRDTALITMSNPTKNPAGLPGDPVISHDANPMGH